MCECVCNQYIHWMARRRGMSVGLLGGLELVLFKLLLFSIDGEA